ncbi:chromosome partition protein MukB [Tolumonas lignilytica]|uniref:chromosome partition protein MukB n=1 Tax=Tolumonas lignilytica TaxID=1283284 RepID=UPI0004B0D8F8|nr:chromosome partition protein MukB [Tolumonas lignilytica]
MITRGKFLSFTMINWNGFFARTFELDQMVTTLSGGNGAGKSTSMAALITALIPDQTLLHFRNTTEAGSSSASRDRGLYGKLQRGHCYSMIDVRNSKGQRLWFGVHLEQVANRDNKVNITPFCMLDVPENLLPTEFLLEKLDDDKAKVRPFNELRKQAAELGAIRFVKFNSVTDYHNIMFEYGVTAKKLRDQRDRSRFYRLIEASLYGGISSSISRSLREYLLPENSGVRKAFQDMEAAIHENRRTLDAIKETQSQRDLFRHLITETTNYVAADFVRNQSEKNRLSELALHGRKQLQDKQRLIKEEKQRAIYLAEEAEQMTAREKHLTEDLELASEHLAKVMAATGLTNKIIQYREDVEELTLKAEEQSAITTELAEEKSELELRKTQSEEEADSLKSQLADYQQALDVQQTRAIQFRQAVNALEQAQKLCELPDLTPDNVVNFQQTLREQEQQATDQVLSLQQRLRLAKAAADQYEKAYAALQQIAGPIAREQAWEKAQEIIEQARNYRAALARRAQVERALQDIRRDLEQQNALVGIQEQLLRQLEQQGNKYDLTDNEQLNLLAEELVVQQDDLQQRLERDQQDRIRVLHQVDATRQQIEALRKKAPAWLVAHEKLDKLQEMTGETLESPVAISQLLQKTLTEERRLEQEKQQLQQQKDALEKQLRNLQQFAGNEDPQLVRISEQLGGVLLTDVYDDISLDDAPYYSALFGPARSAIVVMDLDGAIKHLNTLSDLPDDIYLIQGNPDSFDENLHEATEFDKAVLVRASQREVRYSRYPEIPVFGRAAREQRIELLSAQRDEIVETYAKTAFEQQKQNRLYHHLSQFMTEHLHVAFEDDPEAALTALQSEIRQAENNLQQQQQNEHQYRQRMTALQQQQQLVVRLQSQFNLLFDMTLNERLSQAEAEFAACHEAQLFLDKHEKACRQLESMLDALREDPAAYDELQQAGFVAEQQLTDVRRQAFALDELFARRAYFAYHDAESLLDQTSEISERLKQKLADAEQLRRQLTEQLKQIVQRYQDAIQVQTALHSSLQAKTQTLQEFERELQQMGLQVAADMEDQARGKKRDLEDQLVRTRSRRTQAETQYQICRRDIDSLNQRFNAENKEYRAARHLLLEHKKSWSRVLTLARTNSVEKQLNRRELAYLDADELRSMSDKSLGALRLAVAGDEALRDSLRLSEGNRQTEQKVQFYIQVYRYLKDRIRHDIIRSDDPIDAIEEMEIELARLADELKQRETHLSLSSHEVAAKITNIIRREQNRIRVMNQGLQNITFGQVRGVRLNVNVREAYARLLQTLGEHAQQHQDLFASNELTFSEAMAKLFQRLNPHIDQGDRSFQVLGEALLDYRNYLELEIEVLRGVDGWLRAESGALSTGEAIGTGQAILLMVLQSWEDENRRLRSSDLEPCRLLFLDEAARLDAKSIATLFELCERQDMQLLIAAPENISPEKGTTYKLIRKVHGKQEHVHVVGLRGFGGNTEAA